MVPSFICIPTNDEIKSYEQHFTNILMCRSLYCEFFELCCLFYRYHNSTYITTCTRKNLFKKVSYLKKTYLDNLKKVDFKLIPLNLYEKLVDISNELISLTKMISHKKIDDDEGDEYFQESKENDEYSW